MRIMSKNVQVEKWDSLEDYVQCLVDNGWDQEDIDDQVDYIKRSGDVDWNEDGSFIVYIA